MSSVTLSDKGAIKGINWNKAEDPFDIEVWSKVTQNFWLPEKIALSNDLKSWSTMSEQEQWMTSRVFTGLTVLDTLQGRYGMVSLLDAAQTQHEEAVLANFIFMEQVHAKSYSSIFSTLLSTEGIDNAFKWSEENEHLQAKAQLILEHYEKDDPDKRKVASVMLESFLFYSGFYAPMHWSSKAKLTNTADLIKLIIRDEAIHGMYVGHLLAKSLSKQSQDRQREVRHFAHDLFNELFEIEKAFTAELYDDIGLTADVRRFLKYNANKAFQNMRYDAPFSREETNVNPAIIAAITDTSGSNHDFFSGAGDSYQMIVSEEMADEDWDF